MCAPNDRLRIYFNKKPTVNIDVISFPNRLPRCLTEALLVSSTFLQNETVNGFLAECFSSSHSLHEQVTFYVILEAINFLYYSNQTERDGSRRVAKSLSEVATLTRTVWKFEASRSLTLVGFIVLHNEWISSGERNHVPFRKWQTFPTAYFLASEAQQSSHEVPREARKHTASVQYKTLSNMYTCAQEAMVLMATTFYSW